MRQLLLVFCLILSLSSAFCQQDSAVPEYSHLGVTVGFGMSYGNFDELRQREYMHDLPGNLRLLPVTSNILIGQRDGFFGAFDCSFNMKSKRKTYVAGLNTYDHTLAEFSYFRFGFNLYRNIYFGKHFAIDAATGSSLAVAFASSTHTYNGGNSSAIFFSGKATQHGSVYVGTLLRFFKPRRAGDVGFSLRLGYHIPTAKASWSSPIINIEPMPDISLAGPTAELCLYNWSYSAAWLRKSPPNDQGQPLRNKPAATDSMKTLFKGAALSYVQWDVGYQGSVLKGEWKNMFDANLFGLVFAKRYFTGFGISGFVHTVDMMEASPPQIDSYVEMYWNNEILLNPDKVFNVSIPVRLSYAGATTWDSIPSGSVIAGVSNWNFTGKNYYQHEGSMFLVSVGANAMVNLFKSLSLGVGTHYRVALSVESAIGNEKDFSNFSFRTFLRFRIDARRMRRVQ